MSIATAFFILALVNLASAIFGPKENVGRNQLASVLWMLMAIYFKI